MRLFVSTLALVVLSLGMAACATQKDLNILYNRGIRAARRNPRLARRVHAPASNGGRAHRDRRAGRRAGWSLMPSASRRIGIGFQGGQVLALRVTDEQLKALNKALGGDGWHEIDSDEGPVRLDLAQVTYVRSDSDDLRVGFGS